MKNNLWILSVWHGFGNKKGIINKDKYMTLRQLISALTYYAEEDKFDLDDEVKVNLIVVIYTQMTDSAQNLQ